MKALTRLLLTVSSVALAATFAAAPTTGQTAFPGGETSTLVEIEHPDAERLAAQLEQDGFDVVEGSVRATKLHLVVSSQSWAELLALGFSPKVISIGRPFAEIQADRQREYMERTGLDMPPPGYPTLPEVVGEMADAETNYPAIAKRVALNDEYSLPLTYGGRNVFGMKISDNVDLDEDEPAILIYSLAHARELQTPLNSLDAIQKLTTGYGVDPVITSIVDENEIWVVPVANPDGYAFVFSTNNNWRKNRHPLGGGAIGVDLNRNFAFGWSSACGGSTNPNSDTYRGTAPESELETQYITALSRDKHFAKVLDFHSYGRQTLWEYGCLQHPLATYLRAQAIALSNLASWNGGHRNPSANGEHFEWQYAEFSSYSFLMETMQCCSFQPAFATAEAERDLIWPATRRVLRKAIDVSGHVTDACTGKPLVVDIAYAGNPFTNGERNHSEPDFGRYHAFLPSGPETLVFSAPGYETQNIPVMISEVPIVLDVAMQPNALAAAVTENGSGANPLCYSTITLPVIGGTWTAQVDHSAFPGTTLTYIAVYKNPASGTFGPGGEVLIQLTPPRIFQSVVGSTGSVDTHVNSIPNTPCLAGRFGASQAVVFQGSVWSLCNAEYLTVGY